MPEIPPGFVLVDGAPPQAGEGGSNPGDGCNAERRGDAELNATGGVRGGMGWETWGEGRVSGADDFDAEARRHGGRRSEAAGKSSAESAEAAEIWRLRSAAGATGEVW